LNLPVFFLENPTQTTHLSDEDSHHASKVLRMGVGSEFYLLDGNGTKFVSKIIKIEGKKVYFKELQVVENLPENPQKLHLWIAPTKQMERMEWMVEKCTEMGIKSIGFFVSKNSERKEIKLNRLDKIIVSALKQSKQLYKTQLSEILSFKNLITQLNSEKSVKAFAYISNENISSLAEIAKQKSETHILIGPEGDFSMEEIETLKQNKYEPFSLGKSILRSETAGLICTAAFAIQKGDLKA